jgi:hypothetical protein
MASPVLHWEMNIKLLKYICLNLPLSKMENNKTKTQTSLHRDTGI